MDAAFWHRRWHKAETAFHQTEVNPWLQRYFPPLLDGPARVLVPLCGKSLDMLWLVARGCQVLGVELSEIAVQAFFDEQGLEPEICQQGAFQRYRAGALEIWCGDFFALTAADLAHCTHLYDRAALVALPPEMRRRYAAHLALLPAGCRGLLITLDYPQQQMEGPPFAVPEPEIRQLLAGWAPELLEARVSPAWQARFAAGEPVCEPVYYLHKTA